MKKCLFLLAAGLLLLQEPRLLGEEHGLANSKEAITVEEYGAFLASSPFQDDFYDEKMATDLGAASILRSGEPENYHYEIIGQRDTPISFLSWEETRGYCDWKSSFGLASNFLCCGRGAAHVDPELKSNILTFSLTGTQINESAGEEVIAEAGIEELIEGLLGAAVISAGVGGMPRDPLTHETDSSGIAAPLDSSLITPRKLSDSPQEQISTGGTSSEDRSHSDSSIDLFLQSHPRFKAFERLPERSNSGDEDVIKTRSISPSAPLLPEPLHEPSHEKGHAPYDPNAPLPRTGLSANQCANALRKFVEWRDEIGKYKSLENEVRILSSSVAWRTQEAENYYFYPDKEKIRLRDAAIREHAQVQKALSESRTKVERLGQELDELRKFLFPTIAEKVGQTYPEFLLSSGVSLEKAKQAYREREYILSSGNIEKIEDYFLHNSHYDYGLRWFYLERQTMLNQLALFEQEKHWLDFTDPLKGPYYSYDYERLTRRANQAHANFIESAVSCMVKKCASSTTYINGEFKSENLFTMPLHQLIEKIKKCPLVLEVGHPTNRRDLISIIKSPITSEVEITNRATFLHSWNHEGLQSEIKDAKGYLDWIFGTETKVFTNKVRTDRIESSSPFTRKHFLVEQLKHHLFDEWSVNFYHIDSSPISIFPSKDPVGPYTNLFHQQGIKAASLLDQYRLIMLPPEECEIEIARLQKLTSEEHEAELFQRTRIEDWKLPTTQEELHAYISREAEKWRQEEEAKRAAEAAASNSSNDSYYYDMQKHWDKKRRAEEAERERRERANQSLSSTIVWRNIHEQQRQQRFQAQQRQAWKNAWK